MSLSFSIPDTSPFIHYDPLARWTAAYAPLDGGDAGNGSGGGGGDQTYHQAGVANARIDFNLTGESHILFPSSLVSRVAREGC